MNLHRIHTILSIISGGALIAIVYFSAHASLPIPLHTPSTVAAVILHKEPVTQGEEIATTTTTSSTSPDTLDQDYDLTLVKPKPPETSTSTLSSVINTSLEFLKKITPAQEVEATSTETTATTTDTQSFDEGIHASLTW